MKPVILLMGPTASGKTDLALALADRLPCELISVDSALVYRGLDIGSAKPAAEVLSAYPHHLIDIREPSEPYSAAEFCRDARALIYDIQAKGKYPLLVGGTMLYFRSLVQGLSPMPPANAEVREQLSAEALAVGWPALHQQLQQIDPVAAARISVHDSQRIQRALEVWQLTGQTLTALQALPPLSPFDWPCCPLALLPERSWLHQRIEQRFMQMLELGALEEVRQLQARPELHADLPAIRAVGYRQMWQFLSGEIDYASMVAQGVAATRQLAKRQLTWLRSWEGLHGLDPRAPNLLDQVLKIVDDMPK